MLSKLKKSDNKGFTIIEVMIVLAIAGLILLIVFLAVPALQRQSRNTQRKTDASSIAAALATYISNNNGKLPVSLGANATTNLLDICSAGGAQNGGVGGTACTANTNTEAAKIGYYDLSVNTNVRMTAAGTPAAGFALPTVSATGTAISDTTITRDQVLIVPKVNCSPNGAAYSYSPRTMVVLYVTESASGNGSLQCVEQ